MPRALMPRESRAGEPLRTITRRTAFKWVAASLGSSSLLAAWNWTGADEGAAAEAASAQTSAGAPLLGAPKPINGRPYGGDPTIMTPEITWELTMTPRQLQLAAALSDVVLPAQPGLASGSAVGIPRFLDEWVSSPYERTQQGRADCFLLYEWLERESRARSGAPFVESALADQQLLLDRIAWRDRVESGLEMEAEAFDTFRSLAVSAYFASQEATDWIGYVGNTPGSGDYPGPTEEALEHLRGVLASLDLDLPEGL